MATSERTLSQFAVPVVLCLIVLYLAVYELLWACCNEWIGRAHRMVAGILVAESPAALGRTLLQRLRA
jgi:hypothetical protein